MMLTDLIKQLKVIYKTRGELAIRPDVTAESLLAMAAPADMPKADQIGPVAPVVGLSEPATDFPAEQG